MSTGSVAGLAAITPAAGYVGPMPALVIGTAAAFACYYGGVAASKITRFDDSFGVVATHGIGGLLGMLLVGVFAHVTTDPAGLTTTDGTRLNGLAFGSSPLMWHEVIAVLAVSGFTMAATYILGVTIRTTIGLRETPSDELTGLSTSFGDVGGEADEVLFNPSQHGLQGEDLPPPPLYLGLTNRR